MGTTHPIAAKTDNFIIRRLEQLPVVSRYVKTRGWPYLIAWAHRLSGVMLIFFVCLHVYTLSLLETPLQFNARMQIFSSPYLLFLEWLLAIPVIFHALNGGRLILYESFGNRRDDAVIKLLLCLSIVYVIFLGFLMVAGNQNITAFFFWLPMLTAALSLVYLVTHKIRRAAISWAWKLQRISGVFLLIMIPAHLIFMHLNPAVGHDAAVVIARMQSSFINIIDVTLVLAVLFHGGYGLLSITKDYLNSRWLQRICAVVICGVLAVFGWIGVRLVVVL